jgi:hypothetical protein
MVRLGELEKGSVGGRGRKGECGRAGVRECGSTGVREYRREAGGQLAESSWRRAGGKWQDIVESKLYLNCVINSALSAMHSALGTRQKGIFNTISIYLYTNKNCRTKPAVSTKTQKLNTNLI